MSRAPARRVVEASIDSALAGRPVSDPAEIAALLEVPLFTTESALLLAAGRRLSAVACDGLAEVHAQIAVNIGPCPRNCLFCAFAACNDVFDEQTEVPLDDLVTSCRQLAADGANAVFVMATGLYPFDRFVERLASVREALPPETTLVANVGDFDAGQAVRLRAAGCDGIYHAVRLGEGEVTRIPVAKRLETFAAAREAGLALGTCLEPVGPEHGTAELVEKLLITRDARPVYSGSARRIPIPGTELAPLGVVTEARMAHILAVVRLVLPLEVPGNCTHEPNALAAAAGANLLWAEVGGNPRDTGSRTEEGRGMTVAECRQVLAEAEWQVLDGPSVFYRRPPPKRACTADRG